MDFNKNNFYQSLINIGVRKGQNLFIHSDIGLLKEYKDKKDIQSTCKIIINTLLKVVGKNGSLAFPTFTYSFSNNKRYYPKISKSICGYLSEYARNLELTNSYNDPNVSVVVLGKNKDFLTKNFTMNAYGFDSFFDRFYRLNGHICNINLDSGSTFLHFFEKKLNVTYRFDKSFYGFTKNSKSKSKSQLYVIKKNKLFTVNFEKFHNIAKKYYKTCNIGRGFVGKISLERSFEIIKSQIKKNNNFLIKRI